MDNGDDQLHLKEVKAFGNLPTTTTTTTTTTITTTTTSIATATTSATEPSATSFLGMAGKVFRMFFLLES